MTTYSDSEIRNSFALFEDKLRDTLTKFTNGNVNLVQQRLKVNEDNTSTNHGNAPFSFKIEIGDVVYQLYPNMSRHTKTERPPMLNISLLYRLFYNNELVPEIVKNFEFSQEYLWNPEFFRVKLVNHLKKEEVVCIGCFEQLQTSLLDCFKFIREYIAKMKFTLEENTPSYRVCEEFLGENIDFVRYYLKPLESELENLAFEKTVGYQILNRSDLKDGIFTSLPFVISLSSSFIDNFYISPFVYNKGILNNLHSHWLVNNRLADLNGENMALTLKKIEEILHLASPRILPKDTNTPQENSDLLTVHLEYFHLLDGPTKVLIGNCDEIFKSDFVNSLSIYLNHLCDSLYRRLYYFSISTYGEEIMKDINTAFSGYSVLPYELTLSTPEYFSNLMLVYIKSIDVFLGDSKVMHKTDEFLKLFVKNEEFPHSNLSPTF